MSSLFKKMAEFMHFKSDTLNEDDQKTLNFQKYFGDLKNLENIKIIENKVYEFVNMAIDSIPEAKMKIKRQKIYRENNSKYKIGIYFILYGKFLDRKEDIISISDKLDGKHIESSELSRTTGHAEFDVSSNSRLEDILNLLEGKYNIKIKIAIKNYLKTGSTLESKEGLVFFWYYSDWKTPINNGNYNKAITTLISNKNAVEGISENYKNKVLETLNDNKNDINSFFKDLLNDTLSQALTIKSSYPNCTLFKNELYFDIRRVASEKLGGMPADKWNPADAYILINGIENEISTEILKAKNEPKLVGLNIINNLFERNWGENKANLCGISLKTHEARSGKGRSLITKDPILSEKKYKYDLTNKERQYKYNDIINIQKDMIYNLRNYIKNKCQRQNIVYTCNNQKWNSNKENINDDRKTLHKFAALKMLSFLFKHYVSFKTFLVSFASYSLSMMDGCPTYFVIKGNRKGEITTPVIFPREGGLELTDDPIEIIDTNTAGGLVIKYSIKIKLAEQKAIELSLRFNGPTIISLENEKITY